MTIKETRGYIIATSKFYGATNHKVARIRVDIRGKKYWSSYDYAANNVDVHLNPIKDALSQWDEQEKDRSYELVWSFNDDGSITAIVSF